ncbi:MAG TPA: hypothetical protein VG820_06345 [Fimbriimonadaceae bacterium]|nr:hypothetical protein [Fimbriimonadaceae bacterium]
MSFTIRLAQDLTAVEAGATVPLSIDILNKSDEADRFEMQVEGLDPEWTATPEPVFNVGARETSSQKVFFKPPRASESLAGNYPFVVRIRSLNSGDSRTVQGVLQVKAFNHLSAELNPKKGSVTPFRPQQPFTLTVMNLGNTEHTLQLSGADPEESCTYEFANEQITVGPGQQKEVEVAIRVANGGLFTSTQLYGFVVTARSIQNPNITTSTQGQLERRPLISPGSLLALVAAIAAIVLWIAARPQPPRLHVYVDPSQVTQGQTVHLHWKATNANSVKLTILRNKDNRVLNPETSPDLPTEGNRDITTTDEDSITIRAEAKGENASVNSDPITVLVRAPVAPTTPTISKFQASKTRVKLGESVTFTFEYSADVTRLILSPLTTQQVPLPTKQLQITPAELGDVTYQLFAYNAQGGETSSKKITIQVYQSSDASIVSFNANPAMIQAPETKTTVSWNVVNASIVQLDDGTGGGPKVVDANSTMDVVTDKTVTLKLIATDAKGVTTSKTLTIKYQPLPPIPTDTGGTTGNPPTTTGGAGGTGTTTEGN